MNYGNSLAWKIVFDEKFADDLAALGKPAQIQIKKYLDKLCSDCSHPKQRGEPMRYNLAGLWRYRVGDYRLICQITEGEVVMLGMLMVAHRRESYSGQSIDDLLKRAIELQDNFKKKDNPE